MQTEKDCTCDKNNIEIDLLNSIIETHTRNNSAIIVDGKTKDVKLQTKKFNDPNIEIKSDNYLRSNKEELHLDAITKKSEENSAENDEVKENEIEHEKD